MNALRLYARYAAISLRAQMEYRASFVMQSVGAFLITGVEFLGIWALFARFGNLRGWTLAEVALFYGCVQIAFSIAEGLSAGFDLFAGIVKAGDFDRLLLRPRSTILQLMGHEVTLRRLGKFAQGALILTYAVSALDIAWTLPKAALLVAAVAGGVCVFTGLFILQATLAFWTVDALEIMNIVTYGGQEGASLPLSIYRPWFRALFTFVVPLAAVNYFPSLAILGKTGTGYPPAVLQWSAPLACVVFLYVTCQVWKLGVKHYRSTGS